SSLVPRDQALGHFRIRHPDPQPSDIIVSKSPGSEWQVVGLLDWQHTSILPLYLFLGIPSHFQNFDDQIPLTMTRPSLPENLDDMDETEKSQAKELHRGRLVHYHYVRNTAECNMLHYVAMTDAMSLLCRRLFDHASEPWQGETLDLKAELIVVAANWKTLTGRGTPSPVVFDAEDVRETMEVVKAQKDVNEMEEVRQSVIGYGRETWVSTAHYEVAKTLIEELKNILMTPATLAEERAEITAHWPFDDMDEEKYM
ncbi:hypothetical protein FA95DRAFT_1469404, partial [Auriscalpium vulgare]